MIVRTTKYVCNRCKASAEAEVPRDWEKFDWDGVEYDLCPECASDAKAFLSDVEAFSHVDDNECPMHVSCVAHGFFHGAEAIELREGIEKIIENQSSRGESYAYDRLRNLLEQVDARDSLAYAEMVEKEKKQCAGS